MTETELYKSMIKVVAAGMLLASACTAEVAHAATSQVEHGGTNPDLTGRILD